MLIDEKIFSLTKYASTKGGKKAVKIDPNILFAKIFIQNKNVAWRKPRTEISNLKKKV